MQSINFEDDFTSRMLCWNVETAAAVGGAIEGSCKVQSGSHMSCHSRDMWVLSLGMDVVVAVRVGVCADIAPFCVGRAVIRSVGSPDRMQNCCFQDSMVDAAAFQGPLKAVLVETLLTPGLLLAEYICQ